MASAFAIVDFGSVFENQNLFAFALIFYGSGNFCAVDERFAYGYFAIVYDSQNFIKYDFSTFFRVQLLRSERRLLLLCTVCRRF